MMLVVVAQIMPPQGSLGDPGKVTMPKIDMMSNHLIVILKFSIPSQCRNVATATDKLMA